MIEVDRSGCQYRYNYEHGNGKTYICCKINKPECAHVSCKNVPDFKCTWTLNEKINYLEKKVEELADSILNME